MENLLRRALDNGEFRVHLQPQVDTHTGARWSAPRHWCAGESPELGSVMPTRFHPGSRGFGLIVGLGSWVLRETCRQFMVWRSVVSSCRRYRSTCRSSNWSARNSSMCWSRFWTIPGWSRLPETRTDRIGRHGRRRRLRLAGKLRSLGISLALDDFGTGYSSLSYLKMLPVQQLKIDRSFVEGIGRNAGDEAIIRTIMELARSLDFEVVAEGVKQPNRRIPWLRSVASSCRVFCTGGRWHRPNSVPAGRYGHDILRSPGGCCGGNCVPASCACFCCLADCGGGGRPSVSLATGCARACSAKRSR